MKKGQIADFERRLLRVEVLTWILCGLSGIKIGVEAIPIVSALLG